MTGYTDIEENVLEFFKQNEIVGSIFVNTDTIGKHGFMDMESLKKIDKYISVYSLVFINLFKSNSQFYIYTY